MNMICENENMFTDVPFFKDLQESIDDTIQKNNERLAELQAQTQRDIKDCRSRTVVTLNEIILEHFNEFREAQHESIIEVESIIRFELFKRLRQHADLFDPYMAPEGRFLAHVAVRPDPNATAPYNLLLVHLSVGVPNIRTNGSKTQQPCLDFVLSEIGLLDAGFTDGQPHDLHLKADATHGYVGPLHKWNDKDKIFEAWSLFHELMFPDDPYFAEYYHEQIR